MNQIKIAVGVIAFLILANMFISYNNISLNFFGSSDEEKVALRKDEILKDEAFEFARNTDFCYIDANSDEVCRIEFSNDKKLISIEVLKRDTLFLRRKSVILSVRRFEEMYCLTKLQVGTYTRNLPSDKCSQVYFKNYE